MTLMIQNLHCMRLGPEKMLWIGLQMKKLRFTSKHVLLVNLKVYGLTVEASLHTPKFPPFS